jgi:hypothetical protein
MKVVVNFDKLTVDRQHAKSASKGCEWDARQLALTAASAAAREVMMWAENVPI